MGIVSSARFSFSSGALLNSKEWVHVFLWKVAGCRGLLLRFFRKKKSSDFEYYVFLNICRSFKLAVCMRDLCNVTT